MNKFVLVALSLLVLNSCTVYTEKQSEVLSQNVYATKDSIEQARIDLADSYINEAVRIVKPPKIRIEIKGVYQTPTSPDKVNNTKERVVIVPEKYKNDRVIVVNSLEYETLLKDKAIASQLQKDNANLLKIKNDTDKELQKQAEYTNKMVKDLNELQKQILKKNITILRLSIALGVVLLVFAGAIYLRIKGIL
jgi:hypothetical protein